MCVSTYGDDVATRKSFSQTGELWEMVAGNVIVAGDVMMIDGFYEEVVVLDPRHRIQGESGGLPRFYLGARTAAEHRLEESMLVR